MSDPDFTPLPDAEEQPDVPDVDFTPLPDAAEEPSLLLDEPSHPMPVDRLSDPYAGAQAEYEAEQHEREERIRAGFKFLKEPGLSPEEALHKAAVHFDLPEPIIAANREQWLDAYAKSSADPKRWITENPALAKLALDHPERAEQVVTNKELGAVLQGWWKVVDFVSDHAEAIKDVARPSAQVLSGALMLPTHDALGVGERGVDEGPTDKEKARRAKRDAPKEVVEVDDAEAERIRNSPWGPLAVVNQRAKEANAQLEISKLYHELLMARATGKPTLDISRRLHAAELGAVPKKLDETGATQAFAEAVGISMSGLDVMENALTGMGTTGSVGALAGAGVGLFSRNPALAVKLAGAGASAGAKFGLSYGATEGSFILESGSSYQELLRTRTNAGQPLSEEEARGGALIAASLKTGIELAELAVLLKALGPAGQLLRGGGLQAVQEMLATNAGFRAAAASAAKAWVGEGVEEVAQAAVDDGINYLSKAKHDSSAAVDLALGGVATANFQLAYEATRQIAWEQGPAFDPIKLQENFVGGLLGGALFGGGGLVINLATQARLQAKQERSSLQMPELAKIAATPSAQAMAAEVAKLITDKTSEAGDDVTHIYVDPAGFRRLFQKDSDLKADELLGEKGAEQLAAAETAGAKLEIPLPVYIEKWGKDDVATKLVEHSTVQRHFDTPAQIEENKKRDEEWAQKLADGELSTETTKRFDQLEEQLVATGHFSREEAGAQMDTVRQVFITWAKKFGQKVEDLFQNVRISIDDGTRDLMLQYLKSNASELLSEHARKLTFSQAADLLFVDETTGLLNDAGWDHEMAEAPAASVVSITIPDIKAVNDDVQGGHETADALMRHLSPAVAAIDPRAGRKGTKFVFRGGQAEMQAALERINKLLPKGMSAVGAVGADTKTAAETMDRRTDELRVEEALPARGSTAADLTKLPDLEAGFTKTVEHRAKASDSMRAKVRAMKTADKYFKAAYQDRDVPGVLSALAWRLLPRKKHVASIDIKGLKAINAYGKDVGDRLLKVFAEAVERFDGSDFDFAHLSGDEYAAQHDDPVKLQAWLEHLEAQLRAGGFDIDDTTTGEVLRIQPEFRFGIGEKTYGAADRALNAKKREEKRVRDEGEAAGGDARGSGRDGTEGKPVPPAPGRTGPYQRRGAPRQGYVPKVQPVTKSQRLNQPPTPAQSVEAIQALQVLLDYLRERGAKPVDDAQVGKDLAASIKRVAIQPATDDNGVRRAVEANAEMRAERFPLFDDPARRVRTGKGGLTREVSFRDVGFSSTPHQRRDGIYRPELREAEIPASQKLPGQAELEAFLDQMNRTRDRLFQVPDQKLSLANMRLEAMIRDALATAGVREASLAPLPPGQSELARAYWKEREHGDQNKADEMLEKLRLLEDSDERAREANNEQLDRLGIGDGPETSFRDLDTNIDGALREFGLPVSPQRTGGADWSVSSVFAVPGGQNGRSRYITNEGDSWSVVDRDWEAGNEGGQEIFELYDGTMYGAVEFAAGLAPLKKPRESKKLAAERAQLEEYFRNYGRGDRLYQTASIRSGKEKLEGIDPDEDNRTRDIAIALEKRQRKKYGTIDRKDNSPEASKKIASWMADEVEFEFKNKGKSGVGWYGEKWQRAIDTFASEFPELKKDKTARDVFTILTAVTSDGQKVYTNFKAAATLYAGYRKTGKIAVGAIGSQRAAGMDANFERINEMLSSMGPAKMSKFLLQEKTVSELKQVAKKQGLEFATEYKADVLLPMAAVVLGPKLGAFYANLMGADGYLTMDRWWSRTFNRYRGQLIPAATRPGLDRFKQLLGDPKMDDEEAILHTVEHRNAYEAKGFKEGTEVEKAANTIYKAEFEELEDTPFNATDRSFMLDTARAAKAELAKRGHKVSVADIQAILWYYEKRLYAELGARESADVSYQEVARRVVEERGSEGGSARGDGPRGRAAQSVRRGPAREVQGPDGGSLEVRGPEEVDENGLTPEEAERFRQHQVRQDAKLRLRQPGDDDANGFTDIRHQGMDRVFRIGLTKNANKSTFMHEASHVFLELFGDLASRADAPEAVRKDYATTLQWLGIKDRSEILEKHHEKWARAFEVYLGEGKHPVDSLAGAFQRFRLWMGAVYRKLSELGEISPEIRGVFDRMLATDRELEAQKQRMGLRALPREALGMTPEQYAEHLDELARATSHAQQLADYQVAVDRKRATEEWWKAARFIEKAKADKAYEALPARRAQLILSGKPSGDWLGIKEPLSRKVVVEMVGEKAAKKFNTAPDGVALNLHPDELAGPLGFPTGKAMLEAVLQLPAKDAWVNDKADRAMEDAHPGILEERTKLRETVSAGLHGQYSKAWLLKEWAALNSRGSKDAPQVPPAHVIKRAAELIAAGKPVGRLQPRQALEAERRAANNAQLAAAREDYAQAAVFKQQQVLNHFLFEALRKGEKEVEQLLNEASKLSATAGQQRLGKASPTYRDAVNALLATFDLAPADPAIQTTLDALLADVEKLMAEDQTQVAFDRARIVDRAARRGLSGWKELPLEDMRHVFAAVKNIAAAARNRTTVMLDEKRAELEDVVDGLTREGELLEKKPDPPTPDAETALQGLGRLWTAFDGALLKIETMSRWLSGGKNTEEFIKSMWFRAVIKPMQDAKNRELDLARAHLTPLVERLEAMPEKERHMDLIDGLNLFPQHVPQRVPQRRFEILMMLLNMGNQSNIDRLTRGRAISEGEVWRAAATVGVTKEEYDWVQSVWDTAEGLKPLSFDLEEKNTGVRPAEIIARPFETPFGKYRGGYFPAVYDPISSTGQLQEATMEDFQSPGAIKPSTFRNFLKSRATDYSDLISLSTSSIARHFALVIHDIAFREAVSSVGTVLLQDQVQQVLRERLGEGRAKHFMQWVADIAKMRGAEGIDKSGGLLGLARMLRGNLVTAVLGYKLPNALEDYTSNLLSAIPASDLKPKHLAAALAEFHLPKELGGGDATREMVLEKSPELRGRRNQVQRELAKQVKDLTASGPGVIFARGPLAWYKEGAFAFGDAVEYMTSTPIWLGAYRQALQSEKSEAEAVTFADAIVRQVMVSHNTVDLSGIMRDQKVIGYLLMFHGAFNHFYNQFRNLGHNLTQAADAGEKARMAGRIAGLAVGLFIIGSIARGQGPNKDEHPGEWALRKLLLEGMLQMMPLVNVGGSALSLAMQGKKVQAHDNTLFGLGINTFKSVQKILNSEKNVSERLAELFKLLGLAGVPVSAPMQSFGPVLQWALGENAWRNPLDTASDVTYGKKPDQPWNLLQGVSDAIEGRPRP